VVELGSTVSNLLKRVPGELRLRTKLLLSFVLLTTLLMCATLLVVRQSAEAQAQQQIEREAATARSTFEVAQRQQQMALRRRADLLASLAFMRNGDVTTIEDASRDPWQPGDCNLLVLADRHAIIQAIRVQGPAFPWNVAQEMLRRSTERHESTGWWSSGRNLYQVVVQPFYQDAWSRTNLEGYVVVGRQVDERTANDLGKIAASDVIFRYGEEVAASTLPIRLEGEFKRKMPRRAAPGKIELGGMRYYASPVELAGPGADSAANLIVLKSYAEVEAYLRRVNRLLAGLGLVAVLAGGLVMFVISETVTRPLGSLMQGVQAVERGDFGYPLEAGGHDELAKLTRAFDGMRLTLQKNQEQREQLEGQLRQAQKMDALGRLAGGIAHDFNNLLTVIKGHGELLMDRLPPGEAVHNNCQQIQKTADRAVSLTRQLLTFSRKQVLQAKVLDVNEQIVEMGKLLRRLIREDIVLDLQLGDSVWCVKADPGQLEQVLLNLVVNASDAMPLGGKVMIETQNVVVDERVATWKSVAPGEYVTLSVTDTGHGMDAATMAHIFEPFFTTKEPGKGTGLGLATVYGAVRQSGGYIWVESAPQQGARFEIYLPRTRERTQNQTSDRPKKNGNGAWREKCVLVVEDEREVRELASAFLTSAGYQVLLAEDGAEALEIVERLGSAIHVVLTDVIMPNMRGTELGKRLRVLRPELKIVYMTGYFEREDDGGESLKDFAFLPKPFSRETVTEKIGEALKNGRSKRGIGGVGTVEQVV
jgi:signal transduction histidine kinase